MPTVDYDPRKPLNRQVGEIARTTWEGASSHWNMDIERDGKRSHIRKHFVAPWVIAEEGYLLALEQRATDGIGTKTALYFLDPASVAPAARDAFAMVSDDLIEHGYRMYELQDHIMIETDSDAKGKPTVLGLVSGLAEVAKEHKVAITGGETATLNTLSGFEMGITASGVKLYDTPKGINQHSVLIGLRSSGVHSNGLTWIRDFYRTRIQDGDKKLIEEMTVPTTIYLARLEELLKKLGPKVHGLVHITGGAWSKLLELDPSENFDIKVTGVKAKNPVFKQMFDDGAAAGKPITLTKMYERFNCGIGFVVAVDEDSVEEAMEILREFDPVDLEADIMLKVGALEAPHVTVVDQNFNPGTLVRL